MHQKMTTTIFCDGDKIFSRQQTVHCWPRVTYLVNTLFILYKHSYLAYIICRTNSNSINVTNFKLIFEYYSVILVPKISNHSRGIKFPCTISIYKAIICSYK